MINAVEYQKIKQIGMNIGYILNLYFNNMENINEIKEQVINISTKYITTRDISILKQSLAEIVPDIGLRELLCLLIESVTALNKEEFLVYINSIYIPNDYKFIEDYEQFGHSATKLSKIYHVSSENIFAKITEIKTYRIDDYQENGKRMPH